MTRTHPNQLLDTLISLIIHYNIWQFVAFPYILAVRKAAKHQNKNLSSKSALLIPTVSTSAFHSTNLFLFSYHHIPTNSVAPLFAYKPTHNPKFLQSLWRKAYARNVSFFTLYGGQLTFSTQLLTLNYLLYSTTDAAPQFLKKLTPFTKSWFQILITLKSMRCRGASLQLIMAGSKSYIPTGIFAKARFHIFNRNSISIVISGDGISVKILSIPQVSEKVQRDAIYRKTESSKLSQSKRNLNLTSIAKSTNSNLLLPTSPLPPLPLWEHIVSS